MPSTLGEVSIRPLVGIIGRRIVAAPRHQSRSCNLRRKCVIAVFSGQDAEDLVAATYEVAWRRLDSVPVREQAVPWPFAVGQPRAQTG